MSRQQKQIDALIEGLQKVSAQVEASKLAPQMAKQSVNAQLQRVKYWKFIIENLRNAGWNCGSIMTTDRKGRPATGVFGAHEDYTTLENRAWLHR